MSTPEVFAQRIQKIANNVQTNANLLKRKVALYCQRELTYATPVKTGRARANWQVSLGAAITSPTDNTSSQSAIAVANGVVSGSRPEQAIVIANSVPYINKLNEGWSAQAPAAFVEATINRSRRAFEGQSILIERGSL